MPDFSIITPTLNSASVIEACIQSLREQKGGIEHIIVDGKSSDGTLDVVSNLNSEAIVLGQDPSGIYSAINAGIEAATGEIIGILHADDFYASEDALKLVAEAFRDSEVDACYGDLCYVDSADPSRIVRYWHSGEYSGGRFKHGWMPPHPTFFVRREVYEKHGLYRTDLGTAADYEMMLRLLVKHRISVAYVPHVLVHMRTGGASNATLGARIRANRMDRRAWKVNGLRPYPWTLIAKPARKLGQWWQRP